VNGGYFHEDFRPVGLMVADGKTLHPFQTAKLLSGVFQVRDGKPSIVRSGAFRESAAVTQALQCGPMLVEKGAVVSGLNAERTARRTVVATDQRGRWGLILMTSVSLRGAAEILRTPGVWGDWTIQTALNLDGGGSSGLWAASRPVPLHVPEFSRVRNFLAIRLR
jgi:uncharacterized protein YigE (DUF2233 family)